MNTSTSTNDGTAPRITALPDPRRSRSLEYGVAILKCFTPDRPVLRNSEIASAVGISRATTNRYLSTLVELGYLEQDSKRRYLLARGAARAGMALVNTVRQQSPARAILEDLRNQTGNTVSMGLLDGACALYVYRLYMAAGRDSTRPMGTSASARAFRRTARQLVRRYL
jgi:DNA-binding IclR family transcriptional regulator